MKARVINKPTSGSGVWDFGCRASLFGSQGLGVLPFVACESLQYHFMSNVAIPETKATLDSLINTSIGSMSSPELLNIARFLWILLPCLPSVLHLRFRHFHRPCGSGVLGFRLLPEQRRTLIHHRTEDEDDTTMRAKATTTANATAAENTSTTSTSTNSTSTTSTTSTTTTTIINNTTTTSDSLPPARPAPLPHDYILTQLLHATMKPATATNLATVHAETVLLACLQNYGSREKHQHPAQVSKKSSLDLHPCLWP